MSVAADGAKVADSGEKLSAARGTVFEVEIVERGEDAVARAAAAADTVVVVAGNDPHINGRETEDRTTLDLPPQQERLWRAAHTANPRTVLVLTSAYPYAVAEAAATLPALLWTAHGGQAAGTALARVLAGDVSPAGRLPQTWYAGDADLPDLLDYDIIGSRQTYLYYEGTPLFPFGHGLGYSDFTYSGLAAAREEDRFRVSLTVTNTGTTAADEVAQLYVRAEGPADGLPLRTLVGHRRLHLAPGAGERVEFLVPVTDLGHWSVAHDRWTVEPGAYEFLAGASSADVRAGATVVVDGEPSGPRPVLERGLGAADYDEQRDTVIVDRAKEDGDAVSPAGEFGQLLFRECDFGDGVRAVSVSVAGQGSVVVTVDGVSADLTVPGGEGPYDVRTHDAEFTVRGVHDVRVALHGGVRLAHLAFVSGMESS